MNRRDFFKWLGAGAVAIVGAAEVDVEKFLWVPGEKTIFLPPEKTFVSGEDAQRIYNYYVGQQAELLGLTPRSPYVGREVRTAVGTVALDAFENVVALNGQVVTARKAAELRLKMFTRHNVVAEADIERMTAQVITERVAAGWKNPVGGSFTPGRPQWKNVNLKWKL